MVGKPIADSRRKQTSINIQIFIEHKISIIKTNFLSTLVNNYLFLIKSRAFLYFIDSTGFTPEPETVLMKKCPCFRSRGARDPKLVKNVKSNLMCLKGLLGLRLSDVKLKKKK